MKKQFTLTEMLKTRIKNDIVESIGFSELKRKYGFSNQTVGNYLGRLEKEGVKILISMDGTVKNKE